MPLEKIIQQYELDLKDLKKDFEELKKTVAATDKAISDSSKKSQASLDKVESTVSGKLSGAFKALGKSIAAVFTVRAIVNFATEAINLAAIAQQVKTGFDRLNDPTLLSKLRDAVSGTVSDLKLMQTAVKLNNFKVPLTEMANLLQFAKIRSGELGVSIDQVTDSIVQGLGTKSARSLVSVGISTETLGKKIKETGDFSKAVFGLMADEIAAVGETALTTADKQDQMRASMENLKVQIGTNMLPAMNRLLEVFLDFTDFLGKAGRGIDQFFASLGNEVAKQRIIDRELRESIESISLAYQEQGKTVKEYEQILDSLLLTQKALLLVQYTSGKLGKEDKALLEDTIIRIKILKDIIKNLQPQKPFDDLSKSLGTATEKVFDVTKALEDFGKAITDEVNAAYEAGIPIYNIVLTQNELLKLQYKELTDAVMALAIAEGFRRSAARDAGRRTLEETEGLAREETEIDQIKWDNITANAQSAFNVINELSANATNDQITELDRLLDAQIITQDQYEERKRAALQKQAKQEKALSIFTIALQLLEAIASLNPVGIITATSQLIIAAAKPIPGFAKGVVGLNGPGSETSDEIIARLSKGESIITAKGTRQDKGLFEAANKMQLDKYIHKNYVLPALIKIQQDRAISFDDYRMYRELHKGNKISEIYLSQIAKGVNNNTKRNYGWN